MMWSASVRYNGLKSKLRSNNNNNDNNLSLKSSLNTSSGWFAKELFLLSLSNYFNIIF